MVQRLYGVIDRKAMQLVGQLHLFPSDGVAIRNFQDVVSDPRPSVLSQHPEDYFVAEFGTFETPDDAFPRLSSRDAFVIVVEIAQLVKPPERNQPVVQADPSQGVISFPRTGE